MFHAPSRVPQSTLDENHPLVVSTADSATALLQDDQVKSSPRGPSKNDIFNAPITWLTPPSRPVPVTSSNIQPPAQQPSRNSMFFSSFGSSSPVLPSPPPPPPRISSTQATNMPGKASASHISLDHVQATGSPTVPSAAPISQQTTGRKMGHSRNSSLGRASSEECLQEETRIRTTKHVDFRLCPTNEFLLGEGRHCAVYLGSYRNQPGTNATGTGGMAPSGAWQLCAIKRHHADRQSQLLGLEEAFALRRLGLHPNIIQLIDIRDEVELATSPQPTPQPRDNRAETSSAGFGLEYGLPKTETGNTTLTGKSSTAAQSSHSRSTSDMTGRDQFLYETQSHKRALAQEKQHETALDCGTLDEPGHIHPAALQHRAGVATGNRHQSTLIPNPSFLVQGPEGDPLDNSSKAARADGPSDRDPIRRSSSIGVDPPRLLILLELLPNNLALFARKHSQRIDLQQWFQWALQMVEAVVFLHDKGCVHADIKKENMLLTEDLDIKLCDFNSAVFPNPNDPPRDGLGLGTPAYCAPELSRATGGPTATSFSYPIDVFSLGAVLYSLATGYEPFSKARSVVEMLHRKRLFFESEENDRASRIAVEAGSNPNSQPASRSASLRGRHQKTPSASANDGAIGSASSAQLTASLNRLIQYSSPTSPTFPTTPREASNDSLGSVASSITTIYGRHPTPLAVSRLLEPTDEPRGLLIDPNAPTRQSSLLHKLSSADVRRCASTGGRNALAAGISDLQRLRASGEDVKSTDTAEQKNAAAAFRKGSPAVQRVTGLEVASRPDWLRRRSSYGDEVRSQNVHSSSAAAPIAKDTATEATELSTTPTKPSRLRSMFSPTSAHFSHNSPEENDSNRARLDPERTHLSHPADCCLDTHHDSRPYADGHPAIILPGGGRLPDWARELLRSMLEANPAARPTAQQVRDRLQTGFHQAEA